MHVSCYFIVQQFDSGHSQQVTSVLHCPGLLATASKDGCVHLHTLCSPPTLLSVLEKRRNAITDLDYYSNALAVARARGVAVWTL